MSESLSYRLIDRHIIALLKKKLFLGSSANDSTDANWVVLIRAAANVIFLSRKSSNDGELKVKVCPTFLLPDFILFLFFASYDRIDDRLGVVYEEKKIKYLMCFTSGNLHHQLHLAVQEAESPFIWSIKLTDGKRFSDSTKLTFFSMQLITY